MLQIFLKMLSVTVFTAFIQNTVLIGALGIDESIKGARKPRYLVMYGFWITFFSLALSLGAHFAYPLFDKFLPYSASRDFLGYTVILTAVYFLAAVFCRYILRASKKYMNSLGFCAFNSLVLSLPVLGGTSLTKAVATAIGAAVAYIVSVLIIRGGMRHLSSNPYIPAFFRGTPALFIYISLTSLALSSISSGALFI